MQFSWKIFAFTLTLLKSTIALEKDLFIHPTSNDWTTAWNVCEISNHFLLPDLGLDGFKKSGIFDDFEDEELVWLNAKDVEISYSTSTVHLRLAYIPVNSNVTMYICDEPNFVQIKREHYLSPVTWNEAYNRCNSFSGTLFNVSSPKQAKKTVSLLKSDNPTWVTRTVRERIPNMETSKTDEMCLGVLKMANGSLTYRRDNCSNSHRFACIPSIDKYAPVITEITRPYPVYSWSSRDTNATTTSQYDRDDMTDNASTADGMWYIVSGVLVIVVGVIITIIYLCRRGYCRTSQQNTEMKKHTIGVSNSLTDSYNESHSRNRPGNSASGQIDNQAKHQENEVCMVDCHGDEDLDVSTRYSRYPGLMSNGADLEKLPTYLSMNGIYTQQVSPEYEGFNPDLCRLQQIQGNMNKENQDELNELGIYDKPMIQSVKVKLLDEVKELGKLGKYEDTLIPNRIKPRIVTEVKQVDEFVEYDNIPSKKSNVTVVLDDLGDYDIIPRGKPRLVTETRGHAATPNYVTLMK